MQPEGSNRPQPAPGRHFMSISGVQLPPKKMPLASSFVGTSNFNYTRPNLVPSAPQSQDDASIPRLPDIYTTCPELKQFKVAISLANEQKELQKQPETQAQQVQNQQQQIAQKIRPAQQPIMAQQHPRMPIQPMQMAYPYPLPIFMVFDPNAPIIRPHELGFVPHAEWPPQMLSLWDLRQMYFTRRNGTGRRFDFKLYNALCITKVFPNAYPFVGTLWISATVMKIHSQSFAHLLGIHAIQGGLFHKQGNFSRHGFQQLLKQNASTLAPGYDFRDVDDYSVRLYVDNYNRFSRDTEFVNTDALPNPDETAE